MTPELQIVVVPCLNDNYAYLLRDATGAVAVIDAPEAAPIAAEADRRGWRIDWIWLTHHHNDHVQGVEALRERYGGRVAGAAADAHRLPPLDRQFAEGETIALGASDAVVIDVSGHTVGHVAFHFPGAKAVFTGDSLFVLGCGRLFEGTALQMWASLSKLARLDPATTVWCGHEYTLANLKFARSLEPGNVALARYGAEIEEARAEGRPTVPSTIGRELAANPFLRAKEPALQSALALEGADAAAVFAEARRRKDGF